jgi:hypothetical protein
MLLALIVSIALDPTGAASQSETQVLQQALGREVVWATGASASSEYGDTRWSAAQATGRPDTSACADHDTAWTSKEEDECEEWLEVTFPRSVDATGIAIDAEWCQALTYNIYRRLSKMKRCFVALERAHR